MKIIADTGRQIGKTTELIKLAATTGGVIVVNSSILTPSVHKHAKHLGLELTKYQVASYHQVLRGFLCGRPVKKIVYLDDWDYQRINIKKLVEQCIDFQIGAVVTNKTQAEIEACLQNI